MELNTAGQCIPNFNILDLIQTCENCHWFYDNINVKVVLQLFVLCNTTDSIFNSGGNQVVSLKQSARTLAQGRAKKLLDF